MVTFVVKAEFYDHESDMRWYKILCYNKFEEWCKSQDTSTWKQVPFQDDCIWVNERLYGLILMRNM